MKNIMFVGPAILALLLASSCKNENQNNAGKTKSDPNATKILRFSAIPDENTTEQTAKFKSLPTIYPGNWELKLNSFPQLITPLLSPNLSMGRFTSLGSVA